MTRGTSFTCAVAAGLLASLSATPAHANARITGLADVNYGTITNFTDQAISQNVCVHSVWGATTIRRNYSVRATGNGAGGAFTLASGARTLPYEVRWDDAPNQTTGTLLTSGVNAGGFGNASTAQTCAATETASLTVTITGTSLATATAGTYTGVLTILITPG